MSLKLVVDNTNLVPEQSFDPPIVTTVDEMIDTRSDFEKWLDANTVDEERIQACRAWIAEEDRKQRERMNNRERLPESPWPEPPVGLKRRD